MKKYILYSLLAALAACSQDIPETSKVTDNTENGKISLAQQTLPMAAAMPLPETNDENCKRKFIEAITDKQIQRTLADNCSRRSTNVKPIKHKPWVF